MPSTSLQKEKNGRKGWLIEENKMFWSKLGKDCVKVWEVHELLVQWHWDEFVVCRNVWCKHLCPSFSLIIKQVSFLANKYVFSLLVNKELYEPFQELHIRFLHDTQRFPTILTVPAVYVHVVLKRITTTTNTYRTKSEKDVTVIKTPGITIINRL